MSFLSIGGESLTAMKIAFSIYKRYKVEIPLSVFFLKQNVAELIDAIAEQIDELAEEQDNKDMFTMKKDEMHELDRTEAALQQQGIYFALLSDNDSFAYNNPVFLEILVKVSVPQIEKTLEALVNVHPILNTYFEYDDLKLYIKTQTKNYSNPLIVEHRTMCDIKVATDIYKTYAKPMNPNTPPLFKMIWIDCQSGNSWLIIDISHMIVDGTSLQILLHNFFKLIKGESINEEIRSYWNYCQEQKHFTNSVLFEEYGNKMMGLIEGYTDYLALSMDYPYAKCLNSTAAKIYYKIENWQLKQIKRTAADLDITVQMLLFSAFCLLLYKNTKRNNLLSGIPVINRPDSGYADTVGMFVNLFPVPVHVDGSESAIKFMDNVKNSLLTALQYQEYPFEALIERLNLPRGNFYNPLVSNMFSYQKASSDSNIYIKDHVIIHENEHTSPKFDLSVEIMDYESELSICFEYAEDLLSKNTIHSMNAEYLKLLDNLIENPQRSVDCIVWNRNHDYEEQLVIKGNTSSEFECLHTKISSAVAAAPDLIAIESDQKLTTYFELEIESNRIANILKAKNYGIGDVIALYMERSEKTVFVILGILKIGAVCLPIDSAEKQIQKIERMIEIASAKVILCDDSTATSVLELPDMRINIDEINLREMSLEQYAAVDVTVDSNAFCMFTSGSSGIPKGVFLTHKGIYNHVCAKIREINMNCHDVVSMNFRLSFVASIWQIFAPLFTRARMVIFNEDTVKSMHRFYEQISYRKITVLSTIPSLLHAYLSVQPLKCDNSSLRVILLTGEKVLPEYVKRIYEWNPKVKLINAYGQTECSDDTLHYHITCKDVERLHIPIGKPIQNTNVSIIDENKNILPTGEIGEICISGAGVISSYINPSDETNEKFYIKNGERFYRTGDFGYINEDGMVEYTGRKDAQIKINGIRLETGEIQSHIYKLNIVNHCVVIPQTQENITFVSLYYVGEPSESEVRRICIEHLPIYMVPKYIHKVDKFLLNANGKIDKLALKSITQHLKQPLPPITDTQRTLEEIWRELFKTNNIDLSEDIYSLGGSSIDIMKIISLIGSRLGVAVTFKEVMQNPSINMLSALIDQRSLHNRNIIKRSENRSYYPCTSQQKRIYWDCVLNKKWDAYINHLAFIIEGNLDIDRMKQAFKKLMNRHTALKTVFQIKDGDLRQVICYDAEFVWSIVEQQCDIILDQFKMFDFNYSLSKGPLCWFHIIRIHDRKHALLLSFHHIISDGASLKVLVEDLFDLYFMNETKEVDIQFSDYAVWQEMFNRTDVYHLQKGYWEKEFVSGFPYMCFPMDQQELDTGAEYGFSVTLEDDFVQKLNVFTKKQDITAFQFFFSVYALLVSRITNQDKVCLFSPYSRRTKEEIIKSVGMFVNNLPIIISIDFDEDILSFIKKVSNKLAEVYQYQDFSIDELFQDEAFHQQYIDSDKTMFIYQESIEKVVNLPQDIRIETIHFQNGINKMDLSVEMQETIHGFMFYFEYSRNRFDADKIKKFASGFIKTGKWMLNGNGTIEEFLTWYRQDIETEKQLQSFSQEEQNMQLDYTSLEVKLREIWKNVFKKPHIADDDDFFHLGGDSLKAMQIIQMVYQEFSIDLEFELLLERSSFHEFVAVIAENIVLRERSAASVVTELDPCNKFEASLFQKGIFLQQELNPESTAYNMTLTVELKHKDGDKDDLNESERVKI